MLNSNIQRTLVIVLQKQWPCARVNRWSDSSWLDGELVLLGLDILLGSHFELSL